MLLMVFCNDNVEESALLRDNSDVRSVGSPPGLFRSELLLEGLAMPLTAWCPLGEVSVLTGLLLPRLLTKNCTLLENCGFGRALEGLWCELSDGWRECKLLPAPGVPGLEDIAAAKRNSSYRRPKKGSQSRVATR